MVTAVRWTALPSAGCLPSVVGSVDGWPASHCQLDFEP
jgi:hypothetical protein